MKQALLFFLPALLAANIVSAQETQSLRGLAAEKGYVVCGDAQSWCGTTDVLESPLDKKHEVRCCSETNFSKGNNASKNGGCKVYGASFLKNQSGNYECHHSATFFEADAICKANDARLCTKDEILSRCTRHTGCGHDLDHVWTSTKVPAGVAPIVLPAQPIPEPLAPGAEPYLACGDNSQRYCGGDKAVNVAAPDELHEVRCCSNTAHQNWRKNSGCAIWGESDLIGLNGKVTCQAEKTYFEAVAICAANNARLCTKPEILAKCTSGSGCGYDREMIWTSSLAPEGITEFAQATTESATIAAQPVCSGPVGTVWGDPHFVTFDKLKYDCQGKGEYVIVKSKGDDDPLRIHGRFVDGSKQQNGRATVTRSVAIKVDKDVPVIHVSVPDDDSGGCPFFYSVGNEDNEIPANTLIDYFKQNYDGQANVYTNGMSTILTFPEYSARIEVSSKVSKSNGCVLRTNVCITPEKHGGPDNIVGLLGSPDGIKENDWMESGENGGFLTIPSGTGREYKKAMRKEGFDFCHKNWCVGNSKESLYSVDTFNTYNKCPEEETYSVEEVMNEIDALDPEVAAACETEEDPEGCKLDVVMDVGTGDKEAGLEAVAEIKEDAKCNKKVRELTEDKADGGFEDWAGPKLATTTSKLKVVSTIESVGVSKVLEVQKCISDSIVMTKEEEDQPLPAGAISVDSTSNGEEVTFTITQKWKTDSSVSWITPVFKKGDIDMYCDENAKVNGLTPADDTEPYTADCNPETGKATVTLFVHDGSFKTSSAQNVYDCDGWGNDNSIATYEFEMSCNGESICSSEGTTESTVITPAISGSKGDPHFKTWKREHFEYHGQCDMILTKDAEFAAGLGLEVQIRTKLIRFWSYIKRAAIRIGDDILEVEGSLQDDKERNYWMNLEYQGELKTLGGFPITSKCPANYKCTYEVDLSSKYPGQKIVIGFFKEFINVDFLNASEEAFGNTIGMLGDYKTGKTLARDGVTSLEDFYEFGSEWQVLPSEEMLFHDIEQPQFPHRCIEPEDPRGDRRRRLEESSVTEADAEKACASIADPLDRKDCIYDILATQDIDMVGAY